MPEGSDAGVLDRDPVGDRVAGLTDHADRPNLGPPLLQCQRDSRCEAAAADRDQHRLRIRRLLGQLEPDGALARDDPLVLECVHERRAGRVDMSLRRGDRILEGRACELGHAARTTASPRPSPWGRPAA